VGGTIYNNDHTLESFKELGLDSQTVKKLASKLHFILSIMLPNLSITDISFPALLSLMRRRFQVKPATFLSPLIFYFSIGGGVLRYPVLKLILSLINVGSGFSLPFVPVQNPPQTGPIGTQQGAQGKQTDNSVAPYLLRVSARFLRQELRSKILITLKFKWAANRRPV
jgi:hypothetical protein